jgi:hypothetical protein
MPWLLATSAGAFALVCFLPHHGGLASQVATARDAGVTVAFGALTEPLVAGRAAVDWGLMVVAMMTPLLSMPLSYVWRSSAPGTHLAATAALLLAYWGSWWLAALVFVPLLLVVASVTSSTAAIVLAFALSMTWSASPWAQAARNRCHRTVRIGGLAPGVYLDSAQQGFQTASGCILACWPWMLVPMLPRHGHLLLMAMVTALLFAERIAPLSSPSWRLPPALESIFGADRLLQLSRRIRTGPLYGR